MNASDAQARLAGFFDSRATLQGWLARRSLDRPARGDEMLREHLAAALVARIRPDGSVGGALLPSLQTVLDLTALEIGGPELDRVVGWIMSLEGKPGAFGQGCTAARHPHRTCEHFLGGFFSPAPPVERVAPVSLPNGKAYRIESQARFALSTLALEAVLKAGRASDPGVERHLDSFTQLEPEWAEWSEHLGPELLFQALGALAAAPSRWYRTAVALVQIAGANQAVDGTWSRVDFFHALDYLARIDAPAGLPMLERSLPGLLNRQREDGSFGTVSADERGLIALRVLTRLSRAGQVGSKPA